MLKWNIIKQSREKPILSVFTKNNGKGYAIKLNGKPATVYVEHTSSLLNFSENSATTNSPDLIV